jgi:hypothetical protein
VVLWNLIEMLTNFFSVGSYLYYARRERRQRGLGRWNAVRLHAFESDEEDVAEAS